MKKHYRTENDCLNCGTILQGKFCYNCGQENLEIKETFGHMMNHAVSDYFHFDHQFFHTLKPLLFKPGMLTNEYMAGKRTQFLHPVKMYIFISLIYFVVVFQANNDIIKVDPRGLTNEQIVSLKKTGKFTDLPSERKKGRAQAITMAGDTTYSQYSARQAKLTPDKRDGIFKRYIIKKESDLNNPKLNKKELLTESINHNFPKTMFLLLPLFALILKVTFFRSKKFYVEHLIFSFHLHCFVFLFLTVIILLQLIIPDSWHVISAIIDGLAVAVILWYVYKSLRAVYHCKWYRTITKMIGMSFTYVIALTICTILLVIIATISVV